MEQKEIIKKAFVIFDPTPVLPYLGGSIKTVDPIIKIKIKCPDCCQEAEVAEKPSQPIILSCGCKFSSKDRVEIILRRTKEKMPKPV